MAKRDKLLVEFNKSLKPDWFGYFKDVNILAISEDKSTLPFAFLIKQDDDYLLSLAVDYSDAVNVARLICKLSNFTNFVLSDVFYISINLGSTHFGEEAYKYWELEALDLTNISPLSESLN